jgi:formaldehyde-activating enzyme involved in methanogenesis
MDLDTILFIVSGALAVISTIFGVRYAAVKKALAESKEAVVVIIDAVEDDKVTVVETEAIVKEVKEAAKAWGLVFKKAE